MVRGWTGKDLLSVERVRSEVVKYADIVELFRVPRLGTLIVWKIIPHRQRAAADAGLGDGQCKRNLAGKVGVPQVVHNVGPQLQIMLNHVSKYASGKNDDAVIHIKRRGPIGLRSDLVFVFG